MARVLRAERWSDFRQWAAAAPGAVYRHGSHGWEYVPVHPFGDEPDLLARLGLGAEDCWDVDAWWGVGGDATLLEATVVKVAQCRPGLYARRTEDEQGWVYLRAVLELPFVTRQAFEAAMTQFVALGFPEAELFDLAPDQGSVWLAEVHPADPIVAADRTDHFGFQAGQDHAGQPGG